MLIPSDKNREDCFYCQDISKKENDYPIRKGKYSYEGLVNRCIWHSKFKCSICGQFQHFSYLYWCPTSEKLICGKCNKPTFHPIKFWNKTYAYAFNCKECSEIHYDLLYSEFIGKHPWQIMEEKFLQREEFLIPIIDVDNPWIPIWKPETERIGKYIGVEEALRTENYTHNIIQKVGIVNYHSKIVKDEQVDLSDTKEKWEETSMSWLKIYSKNDEDKGDPSREFIVDPALWGQLGEIKGLRILDAGCGNGYLSRQLAKKGAQVVGVDISKDFIEFCKKREELEHLGCEFFIGSLTELSFLESESFDLVVSNIVMVDVQDYLTAFKEINRVLKKKGRFVWSNLHPVFAGLNQIFYRLPFDTPRNEERLFLMIDRYFDSGAVLMSWSKMKPIWQFHRTLQEYSQALYKAGFYIRELIEPKPSLKDIEENPRTLAFDADRIPFFIIYDCCKL